MLTLVALHLGFSVGLILLSRRRRWGRALLWLMAGSFALWLPLAWPQRAALTSELLALHGLGFALLWGFACLPLLLLGLGGALLSESAASRRASDLAAIRRENRRRMRVLAVATWSGSPLLLAGLYAIFDPAPPNVLLLALAAMWVSAGVGTLVLVGAGGRSLGATTTGSRPDASRNREHSSSTKRVEGDESGSSDGASFSGFGGGDFGGGGADDDY